MNEKRVIVRGASEGLIIEIAPGEWQAALQELHQRLSQSPAFFRGGRVAVRVGPRPLNRDEIEALGHTLLSWGVTLWGIESEALETRAAAASLGLETRLSQGRLLAFGETETPLPPPPATDSSEGIAIRRTLRAGVSLTHRGAILIIGDVNPGAEISAGGNIVVWGKLRGLAHAGATGDPSAVICALRLAPSQLRIADLVLEQPQPPPALADLPHLALVREGKIVIEPWSDSAATTEDAGPRNLWQRFWRRLAHPTRKT